MSEMEPRYDTSSSKIIDNNGYYGFKIGDIPSKINDLIKVLSEYNSSKFKDLNWNYISKGNIIEIKRSNKKQEF